MKYPIIFQNQCFLNNEQVLSFIGETDYKLKELVEFLLTNKEQEILQDIESELEELKADLNCEKVYNETLNNALLKLIDISETLLNYALGLEALNYSAINELEKDFKSIRKGM